MLSTWNRRRTGSERGIHRLFRASLLAALISSDQREFPRRITIEGSALGKANPSWWPARSRRRGSLYVVWNLRDRLPDSDLRIGLCSAPDAYASALDPGRWNCVRGDRDTVGGEGYATEGSRPLSRWFEIRAELAEGCRVLHACHSDTFYPTLAGKQVPGQDGAPGLLFRRAIGGDGRSRGFCRRWSGRG